ncbi:MAG: response regulator [Synergistaceae bacterium]|nr:response regulator [Synergistaceae bacterium]
MKRYIYNASFFLVFLVVFFVILFGGVVYFITSQTLKQQMGRKCLGIASAVVALLEENPEDYRKFIETLDTEGDYYIRTKALMEKIRFGNVDNIAFLYTEVRISENNMMYLFDGEKAGADTFAPPGSIEPLTLTRRKAYENKSPYTGDFVTTVWGTLLSAYVPLFNRDTGEFLGIVGADVSIEQYNAVMNKQFVVIIGSAVIVSIMGYILIRLNRNMLRAEIQNISKSSFLARMSHEMRTPLNTIIGMSEIISHREIPREMLEYVFTIQQAGSNLLSIINDILDFSKIEVGQVHIASERYYFASLINDAVNLTRARMADKPLAFSVKVDGNIPGQLVGDEIRTKQVLLNLLSNAVKYTHSGYVSMDVRFERVEDGRVRLKFIVGDSGVGIKRADIDRLFKDFVRIENAGVKEVEGTGLGLAIARSLCRAMDGDVSVKSEYGHGSTFTATIIQTLCADYGKKLASVNDAENLRVLALEERPIYLDSLSYALSNLGVKSVFARNFADFAERLEGGGYDYAFVASRHIADSVFVIGKSQSRTMLVSMVEMNDVSAYKDINSVTMPIFCINAANALNGVRNEETPVVRKRRLSFRAPDAKVLIVDDISVNLRVSKELMSLYGLESHTCMSGPDAVTMARENRYDIIFMDHMMPGMDGIEAASIIRSTDPDDEYYRSLPIIALTANALSGHREMFLRSGMNDFLAKPIDLQKLDSILQKWLPKEKQLEVGSDVPDISAATDHVELFEIPGVSVGDGLLNSGGSVEAYLDVLEIFCADVEEKSEQIERCAAKRDIGLYMTLVHAFKGASRNIGAMEFGDFAARMEDAARSGDMGVIAGETGAFIASARMLICNIRDSLERSNASRRQGSDDLTRPQMEALRSALAAMDIAAANRLILEYSNLPLGKNSREILSEIENHVLMFDYDKAIEKIDALAE